MPIIVCGDGEMEAPTPATWNERVLQLAWRCVQLVIFAYDSGLVAPRR
jgi:hypothetical protein